MRRARPLMRLDPADVVDAEVWVLEDGGTVAGWHRVTSRSDHAELEDLWLDQPWIGTGQGRILFEHAIQVARTLGATAVEWDADPNAVGFYLAMGAAVVGSTPSALDPGRSLPRMRLEL